MLCTYVEFSIKSECEEAFKALCNELVQESRKEKGNLLYDMGPVLGKPNKFCFFEKWIDQTAVDYHESLPHFTKFDAAVGPMMNGPVVVTKTVPLW